MSRRREARELAKALELSQVHNNSSVPANGSSPAQSSSKRQRQGENMSGLRMQEREVDIVGDSEGEEELGGEVVGRVEMPALKGFPADIFHRSPPSSFTTRDPIQSFPPTTRALPPSRSPQNTLPTIPTLDSIKSFSTTPASRPTGGPSREGATLESPAPVMEGARSTLEAPKSKQRRPKVRTNPNYKPQPLPGAETILAPATESSSHPTPQTSSHGNTIPTPDQGPLTVGSYAPGVGTSQLSPTMGTKVAIPSVQGEGGERKQPVVYGKKGAAARRRSTSGTGDEAPVKEAAVVNVERAGSSEGSSRKRVEVEIRSEGPSKRRIVLSPSRPMAPPEERARSEEIEIISPPPRTSKSKSRPPLALSISGSERGASPDPSTSNGGGKGKKRKRFGEDEEDSEFELDPALLNGKGKGKKRKAGAGTDEESDYAGGPGAKKGKKKVVPPKEVEMEMDPLALVPRAVESGSEFEGSVVVEKSKGEKKGKGKGKAVKEKVEKKKPAPKAAGKVKAVVKKAAQEEFKSREMIEDESDEEIAGGAVVVERAGPSTLQADTPAAADEADMEDDDDEPVIKSKSKRAKMVDGYEEMDGEDEQVVVVAPVAASQKKGKRKVVAEKKGKKGKSGAPPVVLEQEDVDVEMDTGMAGRGGKDVGGGKENEVMDVEEEMETPKQDRKMSPPPFKPAAPVSARVSKPLSENRGFLLDKDGNVKEFKTARDDLPQVVAKSGGVKKSGFSRNSRIPSLHRKIKSPPKKLPPVPIKAQRKKKGEESDDDEEFDEDGKKKIRKGDREWYMQGDDGF